MANLSACRWGLPVLLLCAINGCQTGGNTELLERQLRIQEDRIYQLEDELQRHCKMLQACRKENQTLKAGGPAASPAQTPASTTPTKTTPPKVTPPPELPTDLTPPKLELDLPPVPPPDSSSDAPPVLPGPRLDVPAESEPIAGTRSDGSTLQIRGPSDGKSTSPPKKNERIVDQSAGSGIAPQAYYDEPASESKPSRQATLPAARRPKWSPYR